MPSPGLNPTQKIDPFVDRDEEPTPRRSRVAVVTAVIGLVVSAIITLPVLAEISPNAEITWGVYGLDTNTETDAIQNQVWAIEQIGDRIYVGGKFLEARSSANAVGQSQPYLAAFDAKTGDFIDDFRPQIESAVYTLQASPDGSRLFVGGEFRNIDGDTDAHGLAALDPQTGAVDTSWRAKVSTATGSRPIVNGVTVHGSHLYLAGRFDQVGSGAQTVHATEKVARVALGDGAADTSLTTDIDGSAVWGIAVAPDGSKIFIAGYHDTVDGDARGADYAVLDSTGTLIPDWSDTGGNSTNPDRRYGQDIVVTDNLVFWGGSEHIVRIFSLDDGSLVREHTTSRGGDYQDLEVVGDRVYGSCHCYTEHYADFDYWSTRYGATIPADVLITPIKYVAAYSATTGAYIPEFQLDASATRAGVWAIHGAADGCLWVGGDLSRVTTIAGLDRAAGGFAQFCEGDGSDNRAPDSPLNLVQTRAENTKIVIRWDEAYDNLETTAYEVSRGGVVLATVATTGNSRYWYTDAGLTQGTVHRYSVVAIDAAGNRSLPAEVDAATAGAVVGDDTESPSTPTNLSQTRAENTKIVLRWNASTDNVAVVSYEIRRDAAIVGTKAATAASALWFTDSGLTPGTNHFYEVVAIDEAGNRSTPAGLSAQTTGIAPGNDTEPPTTPANPVQTRSENTKVVIRWDASTDNVGVVSYEITRDGAVVGTETASAASSIWFTDQGLVPATNYDYEIVAVDADGNRSQPAVLRAGTLGAPDGSLPTTPTGLQSTNQTRDRIVLNWVGSPDAVNFAVERDSGDGNGWVEIGTRAGVWYTDQLVSPGTTYSYRIVAIGADGARSEPSVPISVATLP